MVRIRLRRVGSKNQPSYRIVAAEKEAPRDGRFLEVIGHYNPRTEPSTIEVDEARLFDWMKKGAQPSEAVFQALGAGGTWDRWERFKQGESLDKLLEEAKKAFPEVDQRTRRDDLFGKSKKKSKKAAEAAKAEEAPVKEAEETPAEPEVAEESAPEAEVETVEEAEAEEIAEAEAEEVAEAKAEAADVESVEAGESEPESEPEEEQSDEA